MHNLRYRLRWEELLEGVAALDEQRIRQVVDACHSRLLQLKVQPYSEDLLEQQLEVALVVEFGSWIAGWNWAASEPGGGGLVHEYC